MMSGRKGKQPYGCFENNMALLKERNPELAERVAYVEISSQWNMFLAEDGLTTARKIMENDHVHALHSSVSPKKEAEKWAVLLPRNAATLVALGFGLGYHLLSLEGSRYPPSLAIVEADVEVFKLAMNLSDLAPVFSNKKVHIFVGEKLSEIKGFIVSLPHSGLAYREFLPSTFLHPNYYQRVKEILEDRIYKDRLKENPGLSEGIMNLLEETKR